MLDDNEKFFFMYRHQHKADELLKALFYNGWTRTNDMHRSRVTFFDLDVESRIEMINTLVRLGQKIIIYPHGARPMVAYKFKEMRPHPLVSAYVVPTVGHGELLKGMGVEKRMIVAGWWLCKMQPFQALERVPKEVLFGPLHPNANGWLSNFDRSINRLTYNNILKARDRLRFNLTIRYLHTLEENGLPKEEPGITYIQGDTSGNEISQIDRADVVVGHQTFAYKAVARGKPTVMFSENECPRVGNNVETWDFIDQDYWLRNKHLYMYPFDLNDTKSSPAQVILDACSPFAAEKTVYWRERFIGKPIDHQKFADEVERVLLF